MNLSPVMYTMSGEPRFYFLDSIGRLRCVRPIVVFKNGVASEAYEIVDEETKPKRWYEKFLWWRKK